MQVSNADIWNARAAFDELLKERLPVKTAYWLAKLARKVGEQARDIETVRVKLVKDYGQPDEQGNVMVAPDSPQWVPFTTAYGELMAETVELEGLPAEKLLLPSDNGLHVSAATLLALEPFVEVA